MVGALAARAQPGAFECPAGISRPVTIRAEVGMTNRFLAKPRSAPTAPEIMARERVALQVLSSPAVVPSERLAVRRSAASSAT
jgi:hypothetical protein